MTDQRGLWEVRDLPDGLALELRAGDNPALILLQGENRIRVDLSNVKTLVAALTDAAADLADVVSEVGGESSTLSSLRSEVEIMVVPRSY